MTSAIAKSASGKGIGDWYGYDTEIKMGKQYAMMVESSARMIQDPVIVEYVNRIGQNLVRNSDAKVPFTIKVHRLRRHQRVCLARRIFLRQ